MYNMNAFENLLVDNKKLANFQHSTTFNVWQLSRFNNFQLSSLITFNIQQLQYLTTFKQPSRFNFEDFHFRTLKFQVSHFRSLKTQVWSLKFLTFVHSVQYIITEVDPSLKFNIKSINVSATIRRFCLSSYISTAKENV